MASGADQFLKKALGDDFFESLAKVELWKPGTKTTIDHEEVKTALQIVPRTVMAMLIRELSPMEVGQTKEIDLPVPGPHALIRVSKHERDVYSGEIEQDNKKVTEFKFRSIPGVGLVIMSAFELYSMEEMAQPKPDLASDAEDKIQKLIDERLALHDIINRVVDKKLAQKDALHRLMLLKLTEELEAASKLKRDVADLARISKDSAGSDEYLRGMANGIEVVNATAQKKEPEFVESPKKKGSPLKGFLDSRKKKKEFSVQLAKGENVNCPDCGKNIFDGKIFSGCVCLGDDMERKVFIKKSEDGVTVRFSKGWDEENIEMLLEVLRRKRD